LNEREEASEEHFLWTVGVDASNFECSVKNSQSFGIINWKSYYSDRLL